MSENGLKEKKEGTCVVFWLYPFTAEKVYHSLHQQTPKLLNYSLDLFTFICLYLY